MKESSYSTIWPAFVCKKLECLEGVITKDKLIRDNGIILHLDTGCSANYGGA